MTERLTKLVTQAVKWVRWKYGTHTEVEELAQEAAISIWTSLEKGQPEHFAFQEMKYRVLNLVSPESRALYTGMPRRTPGKMVTKRGEATREKVRQYIKEYRDLHGETPSTYRIAKGTGLGEGPINNALKHLHVKSAEDTPRDPPTTRWMDESEIDDSNAGHLKFLQEQNKATSVPSPEEEVLSRVSLGQIVSRTELTDTMKTILYGLYWQDKNQAALAREEGIAGSTVWKIHKDALGRLRTTAEMMVE